MTTINFTLPTHELHSRQIANGCTAYTYEQIEAKYAEMQEVSQELEALLAMAWPIIEPHDIFAGCIADAPKEVQVLNKAACMHTPIFSLASKSHTREVYPMSVWEKDIATYRNVIKKVRKALEAFPQIPVVEEVPATELVSRPAKIQTVSFEMGGKTYQTRSSWSLLD